LTQGISAPGALVQTLCWKKVFMMHSALLHHSSTRSLPLSFTSASPCRPITPFIPTHRSQSVCWSLPKESWIH